MPQLAQGRELGEAKKPKGVAMLRLAFQRADHERAGKSETKALGLAWFRASTATITIAVTGCSIEATLTYARIDN
jgi:hypothetical protein